MLPSFSTCLHTINTEDLGLELLHQPAALRKDHVGWAIKLLSTVVPRTCHWRGAGAAPRCILPMWTGPCAEEMPALSAFYHQYLSKIPAQEGTGTPVGAQDSCPTPLAALLPWSLT